MAMLVASAVPVSFLLGALLAVRRLSADSEILAMRASGMGSQQLLKPLLVLGVLFAVLSAYLTIFVEHRVRGTRTSSAYDPRDRRCSSTRTTEGPCGRCRPGRD